MARLKTHKDFHCDFCGERFRYADKLQCDHCGAERDYEDLHKHMVAYLSSSASLIIPDVTTEYRRSSRFSVLR